MSINHVINNNPNVSSIEGLDPNGFRPILIKDNVVLTDEKLRDEDLRFMNYLDKIGGFLTTTTWARNQLKLIKEQIPKELHSRYLI